MAGVSECPSAAFREAYFGGTEMALESMGRDEDGLQVSHYSYSTAGGTCECVQNKGKRGRLRVMALTTAQPERASNYSKILLCEERSRRCGFVSCTGTALRGRVELSQASKAHAAAKEMVKVLTHHRLQLRRLRSSWPPVRLQPHCPGSIR